MFFFGFPKNNKKKNNAYNYIKRYYTAIKYFNQGIVLKRFLPATTQKLKTNKKKKNRLKRVPIKKNAEERFDACRLMNGNYISYFFRMHTNLYEFFTTQTVA